MKRLVIAAVAVGAVLAAALVVMGGLGYRREVEYQASSPTDGALPGVNIQNVRLGGWGHESLVEASSYGPPFDLLVYGTLPEETGVAAVALCRLVVKSPHLKYLEVGSVALSLEKTTTISGGRQANTKSFSFSSRAFLSETPSSVEVSGVLTLTGPEGPKEASFRRVFVLRRFRRLSLGAHEWHL